MKAGLERDDDGWTGTASVIEAREPVVFRTPEVASAHRSKAMARWQGLPSRVQASTVASPRACAPCIMAICWVGVAVAIA